MENICLEREKKAVFQGEGMALAQRMEGDSVWEPGDGSLLLQSPSKAARQTSRGRLSPAGSLDHHAWLLRLNFIWRLLRRDPILHIRRKPWATM